MSQSTKISEGEAEYDVPAAGKPCKTWYKVFGDLEDPARKRPLVALHGGPGSCHIYLLSLAKIWENYQIPVIMYDQIGNGNSTHLPEKVGDMSFWTEELFRNELDNLLRYLRIDGDYDLFGQSWGGMISSAFATYRPKGLKRLILADAPASIPLWIKSAYKLRSELPEEVQATLTEHEEAKTLTSKEYEEAISVFYKRHLCRLEIWPEELIRTYATLKNDPTVYISLNGFNEFIIIGYLKDWSVIDDLHKIEVPTLVINGKYDPTQDEAVLPFFEKIPKCKWVRFEESSHLPHVEEPERFLEVVGEFLSYE
ncbi:hypothetical protein Clacol_000839 [Clathrus columnatus]|uniref:AB hydrolase-1 domain-containing protein n=1 Tax=Clathrus columnatus TaxID=1419009 RepID=A0AAV4ZXV6_9AGAM|nr:hypothetical protein Clacol_000839 [Clathrus columnatus]